MHLDPESYNRVGARELMERVRSGETLLVQGPMGSLLMSEDGAAKIPPAYWNLAEPQAVERLHRLYADAGADVLVANTFQASSPALERDEVYAGMLEVNDVAVRAARAAGGSHVLGSVGPCGLSWYEKDSPEFRRVRSVYRDQCRALLAAGADGLLLETFTSINELIPALEGALDVADGMPALVSFAVDDGGNLLSDGLNVEAAVVWSEKHGASAVGVNCCNLSACEGIAERMVASARTPVMVRPSAGLPCGVREDGAPVWNERSDDFAAAAVALRRAGVRLVGTCCGSTPLATCAMRAALDEEA